MHSSRRQSMLCAAFCAALLGLVGSASATTAVAAATSKTPNPGLTSIMVPGFVPGCSGAVSSCSTSYSFSWTGGAQISTSASSTPIPTTPMPSVKASSTDSGTPSNTPTSMAKSTLMSTPTSSSIITSTSMTTSMSSQMPTTASISATQQISCPPNSGILSSWTTTATVMEDFAVVISTYIAGFNGVATPDLCDIGRETWMPVPTTDTLPTSAIAPTNQNVSSTESTAWTTTVTAQQGTNSVVLALENILASNGATQILSTISSSTLPPITSTTSEPGTSSTISSMLPSSSAPAPSSAVMTPSTMVSSATQMTSPQIIYTPGATWTTTTTVTQGDTVIYVDVLSKATDGVSLVFTQLSASTLTSGLAFGSSAVSPIPSVSTPISSSSGITVVPISAPSAPTASTMTTAPSPDSAQPTSSVLAPGTAISASSPATGTPSIGGSFTSSSVTTNSKNSTSIMPSVTSLGNSSFDTAWNPSGSTISSAFTYTVSDGSSGEVVVGENYFLISSINAHSTLTEVLKASIVTVIPWTGSPPANTAAPSSVSVSISTTASASNVTDSQSSPTSTPSPSSFSSMTSMSSMDSASAMNPNTTPASKEAVRTPVNESRSTAASIPVIISSSTQTRTVTVTVSSNVQSSIMAMTSPTTPSITPREVVHNSPTTHDPDDASNGGDIPKLAVRGPLSTDVVGGTRPVAKDGPGLLISAAEKEPGGMQCWFPFWGCVIVEYVIGAAIAITLHWFLFRHWW